MHEATFEKTGNYLRLHIGYYEGSRITFKYEENIYSVVFTVDEQGIVGNNPAYIHNANDALKLRWVDRSTNSSVYLHNCNNITLDLRTDICNLSRS